MTANTRDIRRPWYALVLAAVGVPVVVGCAALAYDRTVSRPEQAVFEAINGLPDLLFRPMWVLQLMGLIGLPVVVGLVALALRRTRLAFAALAAVPLKLFVVQPLIKHYVHRERPGLSQPDPILRGVPDGGASFPSGHAVVAFTLATLLTPYIGRRWVVPVWVLAALNSVARVYLGAHNPLDVLAGAGAGVALGGLLTFAVGVPAPTREDPLAVRPATLGDA
jgi:membrane-associated phospholipid phosphatase